jgi:hypothetical protein
MTHRLAGYLGELATVVGHAGRVRPLMAHCGDEAGVRSRSAPEAQVLMIRKFVDDSLRELALLHVAEHRSPSRTGRTALTSLPTSALNVEMLDN